MTRTPTRKALETALAKLRKRYGHRPEVTAFDIGHRWIDDAPTDEVCLRVHVSRKIPEPELSDLQIFAPEMDGIRVDVVSRTYCVHLQTGEDSSVNTPFLVSGSACSRADTAGGGTVGALVVDNRSGLPGFLSNWHVLCGPRGAPGDRIVSRSDGVTRPLGTLVRSDLSEWGDAAFARIEGATPWLPGVMGASMMVAGSRTSKLGEVLTKYGRTTGLTQARVDGEGYYRVAFKDPSGGEDIREIRGLKLVPLNPGDRQTLGISAHGDSGALWLDPDSGQAVGLHFAGEGSALDAREYALACDVGTVLDRLDVRLATLSDVLEMGASTPDPVAGRPDPLTTVARAAPKVARFPQPDRAEPVRRDPMPIMVPVSGPVGRPTGGPIGEPVGGSPAVSACRSLLEDPRDWPGSDADWTHHDMQPANMDAQWRKPALYDGFDTGVLPLGRVDSETAISVSDDIWPELAASFQAACPELRAGLLHPSTEIRQVIGDRDPGLVLSHVICGSDSFSQDGVLPAWLVLRRARTFAEVCQHIGRAYRDLGYSVTFC